MSLYNLDNLTNFSGDPTVLFKAANTFSDGLLFPLFLVGLWFVLFISMKNFPFKAAFSTASFVVASVAVFLRIAGIIADWWLILFSLLAGIGIVLLFREE